MQTPTLLPPTAIVVNRYHVDLTTRAVRFEPVQSEDLEDALGGIARATKLLAGVAVDDPYAPSSPLVMNLGLLSGTSVMTGLRTFFHGYSPLKVSDSGSPGLMWSAGSGHFGTKLRGLGIDEVIFTGRAERPTLLHLTPGEDGEPAVFEFLDASDLSRATVNERIQGLYGRFPRAHFAAVGPAAEHYESVRYASIALSTDNQLESGDAKPRFCGRGGYGGVMASKNLGRLLPTAPTRLGHGVSGTSTAKSTSDRAAPGIGISRTIAAAPGGRCCGCTTSRQSLSSIMRRRTPTLLWFCAGRAWRRGRIKSRLRAATSVGFVATRTSTTKARMVRSGSSTAKVDYEPITLLSSNLGIYDPGAAFSLIHLADELGLDSISLGVTLGYAMDYNRRNNGDLVGGLEFGDAAGVDRAIRAVARGDLPELGQGVRRLADETGEAGYAMHSKGVEYPAFPPHINPGFPWALAGGHMSMRTFMLYISEKQTDLDYWVNAITDSGPLYLMDDITGLCKFANLSPEVEAEALRIASGLDITAGALVDVVMNTQLRGYANERRQGFDVGDYRLPAEAHGPLGDSEIGVFNTPEFFDELRAKVMERMDRRAAAAGIATA